MKDDIAAVRAQWVEALNAGSAEAFVRCITEDAVWLPPHGEAIQGREEIVRWLKPLFAQFRYEYSITDAHVRLAGEWAVEEARFRTVLHSRTAESEPAVHEGRYLLLWRRLPADEWLIERYVDRSDRSTTP